MILIGDLAYMTDCLPALLVLKAVLPKIGHSDGVTINIAAVLQARTEQKPSTVFCNSTRRISI